MNRQALVVVAAAALSLAACGERAKVAFDGPGAPLDGGGFDTGRPDAPGAVKDLQQPDLACPCSLAVIEIDGKPVSGIKTVPLGSLVTVELVSPCTPDGAKVTLSLMGGGPTPSATVWGGRALFKGIKVWPTATSSFGIKAQVPGCSSGAMVFYSVSGIPGCTIVQPAHGSTLYPTSPFYVKVTTKNAQGGTASLRINGAYLGTPQTVGPTGKFTFPNPVLPTGTVTIEVKVTVATYEASCKSTVTVLPPPKCVLSATPAPTTTLKGNGYNTHSIFFDIATSPVISSVVLKELNSNQSWTVTPVSAVAKFYALTLMEGSRKMQATCTDLATGATAKSATISFLVDVTPPPAISDLACKLTSPSMITCTWTGVSDGAAGIGLAHYLISYTTTAGVTASVKVTPVAAGNTNTVEFKNLAAGTYALSVQAVDYLNNASVSNLPAAIVIP